MKTTHRLSDREWADVQEVYDTLTRITVTHAHWCDCGLCMARAFTNCDDPKFREVECEVEPPKKD